MKNTNYLLFLTANFLNRLSQVRASYDAIMDAVGKVEAVSKLHDHTFECTGVLVGPCLMLTSQFCIADPINYGAYRDYVRFMPGYAMGYSQGVGIGT
jgi:V8-like Glu-specific endopeptidase